MKDAAKEKRLELLFEVGCEEIPAGMLPKAEEELRANIEKLLTAENLFDGVSVETFSAPRRLTAWVRGMLAKPADVEYVERYGAALRLYRDGRFEDAAREWAALAHNADGPAARMGERAHQLVITAPAQWNGVWELLNK